MSDRYEDLAQLIARYLRQELTVEEQATLDAWLAERPENRKFLEELADTKHLQQKIQAFNEVDRERLWTLTQMKLTEGGFVRRYPNRRINRWLPYAAALFVVLGTVAWYVLRKQPNSEHEIAKLQVADIPPGGNRATLTLADGRTITLDEAQDGIVIGSGEITYNDGNPLIDVEGKDEITLLELTTPKGGTYQITLPDGTQVWVNAESTLKYPSRFPNTERRVELVGEAFFAVTKDKKRPFKVISNGQEVQVMGTAFNVSAYPDDQKTKTTLVEGKIRLSLSGERKGTALGEDSYIELIPGEQAIINGGNLIKTNVDTALYTAWKSGYFYFKRTPLKEILRQAARWYDVAVVYQDGVPDETFSGDMRRDVSLRGLLDILQHSTINVTLEERTLTVRK